LVHLFVDYFYSESGEKYEYLRNFRADKRNKLARVLVVRQAPSLKKWREFRLRTLYVFPIFPVNSDILTSLMES